MLKQLNQLPEVARFVREFGNADAYIGLKINYQPGNVFDRKFFQLFKMFLYILES